MKQVKSNNSSSNIPNIKILLSAVFKSASDDALSILIAFTEPVHIHRQHKIIEQMEIHPDRFYRIKNLLIKLSLIEQIKTSLPGRFDKENKKEMKVYIKTNKINLKKFLSDIITEYELLEIQGVSI